MGRFIFISLFMMMAWICSAAEQVVIDGIRYVLQKNNVVACAAVDKAILVDVELPMTVNIKGVDYYLEAIQPEGFSKCKNLKSIIIPNSVRTIGEYAFKDCQNLESVIMPDDAEAKIFSGNYGVGRSGIFKGCAKLANVSGHYVPYPKYVVYDAFYNCSETPFYNTITEEGSVELTERTYNAENFSSFAAARLKRIVEEWQVRKPYETQNQWSSRVNDLSRQDFINHTLATIKYEYITKYAPRTLRGRLGDYVSEYQYFPIDINNQLGTVYVTVPDIEHELFSANWSDVLIRPSYGIMDDNVAILSCKFILGDKEYSSARSYTEDEFTSLIAPITPLATIREYELNLQANNDSQNLVKTFKPDTVDINIPYSGNDNSKTFAVIIGNEHYQRVAKVDFALNDARIFEQYCERTLGIPKTNIRTYIDATYGDLIAALNDLRDIVSSYDGDIKVLVYYAGHGVPEEGSRNAYILPVDAAETDLETCYPLSRLYDELGSLNVESVVVLLDACFSGSVRGDGMLASARGIRLKPRQLHLSGGLVVISAATGEQSALPYQEKSHGLFTYYLLEKLNSTKGDVKLGELADYITKQVSRQSVVVNRKSQTPTVSFSPDITFSWRNIQLK